mmetsp:Transcript_40255/g.76957  ORF Transcript_40255/g.76957 Transcript_40255/m.76957 type:complete len:204 (-) Transcript_40255:294-905(-)
MRGLHPCWSATWISAPESTSSSVHSWWPYSHAASNAVHPCASLASMPTPSVSAQPKLAASSSVTISTWPCVAAALRARPLAISSHTACMPRKPAASSTFTTPRWPRTHAAAKARPSPPGSSRELEARPPEELLEKLLSAINVPRSSLHISAEPALAANMSAVQPLYCPSACREGCAARRTSSCATASPSARAASISADHPSLS